MLYSRLLRSVDVSANRELDLGTDHRCVSAFIEYISLTEAWQILKRSLKGWKPIRDKARQLHECYPQLEN